MPFHHSPTGSEMFSVPDGN